MRKKSGKLLDSIRPALTEDLSLQDQLGGDTPVINKWMGIARDNRIQDQFVQKYGEPVFTTCQIEMMLKHSGYSEYSSDKLFYRIEVAHLGVSQDDLKDFTGLRGRKHFVRRSNLPTLMEKLGVSVKLDKLDEVARELGYII